MTPDVNPYAPVESTESIPLPNPLPDEFNGNQLAWRTFSYVIVSGGVFGFGFVFFGAMTTLIGGGSFGFDGSLHRILSALMFFIPAIAAAVIGMGLAAISATVVVPTTYAIATHMIVKKEVDSQATIWTGKAVRLFGAACGFVSGWLCIAVFVIISGSFELILVGLVPGFVGSLVTTVMLNRTAKRADLILQRQLDQRPNEEAPIDPLRAID